MKNKDIEARLIELYVKGWITKEELEEKLEELNKKDMPKPPTVY